MYDWIFVASPRHKVYHCLVVVSWSVEPGLNGANNKSACKHITFSSMFHLGCFSFFHFKALVAIKANLNYVSQDV